MINRDDLVMLLTDMHVEGVRFWEPDPDTSTERRPKAYTRDEIVDAILALDLGRSPEAIIGYSTPATPPDRHTMIGGGFRGDE